MDSVAMVSFIHGLGAPLFLLLLENLKGGNRGNLILKIGSLLLTVSVIRGGGG